MFFSFFQETEDQFTALQYALFIMCFIEVIGSALFFVTSRYVVEDKLKVDIAIHGKWADEEEGEMDGRGGSTIIMGMTKETFQCKQFPGAPIEMVESSPDSTVERF